MIRLASSLLLIALFLATAPPADAQLGGLLNRAKRAISGGSSTETAPGHTPEAGPVSQNASSPDSSADSRASLPDGSTAPVLDMFDLLTMTYNARNGLIKPHDLTLVFPIGERDSRNAVGEYILRDASGAVVFRRALKEKNSLTPIFRTLQSTELAFGPLAAGTYTTEVTYKDHEVGRLPFTVEERNVGDAYSPQMLRIRDGAWRTLGLFEHPTDRRSQALLFSCWLHPDDVVAERTDIRFELTRGGEFVADSKMVIGSLNGWTLAQHELRKRNERDQRIPFVIDDVQPGAYTLTVSRESDGHIIKTFSVEGKEGGFVPHPRSALDYEPHADHLTPRRPGWFHHIKTHGANENTMSSAYWVETPASP